MLTLVAITILWHINAPAWLWLLFGGVWLWEAFWRLIDSVEFKRADGILVWKRSR